MSFASRENRTLKDVRVLFTKSLFEAKGFMGGEPKYSVMVILDKKNKAHMGFLNTLNADANSAAAELWPDEKTRPRSPFYGDSYLCPIKDGDSAINKDGIPYCEKNPELAGHWFIQPKTKDAPLVIDLAHRPLTSTEVYSGCFCNVGVNVFAYDIQTGQGGRTRGVTIGLNGVQKVRDGERIGGGRPSAEDIFGAAQATGFDDPSNYDSAGGDTFDNSRQPAMAGEYDDEPF